MSARVLVIAEVGSTHDGSLGIAQNSAAAAVAAGAGAVKFQTHVAAAETTRHAPAPGFFSAEPRFEYFTRTGFAADGWQALAAAVHAAGAEFISSPFAVEAIPLLEDAGIDRYKIPSGEITNLPLIEAVAETGRPVVLSSGMSAWAEVDAAVAAIRRHHDRLAVLQCTSEYPCAYEHVGLNVMREMRERYGCPVGLSDHTLTPWAAVAAVMAGADIIEKHFTLSRHLYGSDARHSMEPAGFADMTDGIRAAEILRRADVDKNAIAPFAEMRRVFQKSVVSIGAIPRGTTISREMLGIKKPGTGLPPARLETLVGRRALADIPADSVIRPAWVGLDDSEAQSRE